MVVRPVLTSGPLIWWWRIRCNISRLEFSKLWRLVCIDVTGVMKMAPRAAMEVLLDFLLCVCGDSGGGLGRDLQTLTVET
jgi:hypothetical protein